MKTVSNLEQHQQVLYELLEEFDRVCKKHGIKYMLFAGTALGAVRHGGIIPWDDDLDVVMLRGEYEKFLTVAPQEIDFKKYYLQAEFTEHWPMFFSKLRKNNTACIEKVKVKDEKMHQGIYIDIFPCDNLSDNGLARKMQFCASKIVIAKSLFKRGYRTDSLLKKVVMVVSHLFPQKLFAKFVCMKEKTDTQYVHTFFGAASRYEKNIYPRSWLTESIMMKLGDNEYSVPAHYDELLTKLYGDYMTPPTEEQKKIKVHAALVDVNNSYTIYVEEQKRMKFDDYTKSIR